MRRCLPYRAAMQWYAALAGHGFDLEDLAELFPVGAVCVVRRDDGFFLGADDLVNGDDAVALLEVAESHLRRVNGVARLLHPAFRPVTTTGLLRSEDGRTTSVVTADSVENRGL